MKALLKLLWIIALLLFLTSVSMVIYDFARTREAFPPGAYIAGVDVSLLTRQEAAKKLKDRPLTHLFASAITLESDKQIFTFKPDELGIHVLYGDTVDKAFKLAHQGSYIDQLRSRVDNGQVNAPLVLDIYEDQLQAVMERLAEEIRTTPRNATMTYFEKTGGFNIMADDPGRELNVPRSIVRFKVRLYKGQKVIPLVIDYQRPKVTEKELREHPPVYQLSGYTTYYGTHDDPNRIHNIKLVASWVNGMLLMPGDIFSVAEILGDVTEEQGFREAYVIIGGELVPTLGGGACQVATTLFNAVSLADLKVLQRRNHSFYFNIYPLGRDAAVYPGQVDFQFENDTKYPILIKANATNRKLSFRIYGTPSDRKVKFSQVKIEGKEDGKYVPMSLKDVINKDVPFRTSITRTVWDASGNKLIEEEVISKYKLYGDKDNVPIRRPEAG
ncbi:MAG: VanW family protein [Candidatus Saganbacteria bacterium]|nr:VanW family protein [Candidatus Saganbacteria bacterium]